MAVMCWIVEKIAATTTMVMMVNCDGDSYEGEEDDDDDLDGNCDLGDGDSEEHGCENAGDDFRRACANEADFEQLSIHQ